MYNNVDSEAKRLKLELMIMLVIGVVSVALTLTVMGSQMGSDYEEMGQAVASVSVGLAFLGIVLIALVDSSAPRGCCVLFGGFAGIVFAYILKALYDGGVLIDEFITGSIVISDLMGLTVIVWIMVGIIMEVVRS